MAKLFGLLFFIKINFVYFQFSVSQFTWQLWQTNNSVKSNRPNKIMKKGLMLWLGPKKNLYLMSSYFIYLRKAARKSKRIRSANRSKIILLEAIIKWILDTVWPDAGIKILHTVWPDAGIKINSKFPILATKVIQVTFYYR